MSSKVPLLKDLWCWLAEKWLTKNEIGALRATCKQFSAWLNDNPQRRVVEHEWVWFGPMIKQEPEWSAAADEQCECISFLFIDRGVENFAAFGKLLKELYPKIRELSFRQNYSYDGMLNDNRDYFMLTFIRFIRELNLIYLNVDDRQTEWIREMDWALLLNNMPDYAVYVFGHDVEACTLGDKCPLRQVYQNGSRTLKTHIHYPSDSGYEDDYSV